MLIATISRDLPMLLGDALIGLYIRGSLAMGDFDPATSDVDLFAVTAYPITAPLFDRLAAWHQELSRSPMPFADALEIAYVDRENARRFRPGRCFPTLERGGHLRWVEHGANWVLERWVLREQGIILRGPNPTTLIDPVTPAHMREAVRARIADWVAWAADEADPDWQLPRSHKAYVIETMCRALYTATHGTWVSKPHAVAWAQTTLPQPWRALVERSRTWRTDPTPAPEVNPLLRRFIHWTAARILSQS